MLVPHGDQYNLNKLKYKYEITRGFTMSGDITVTGLTQLFKEKVVEVQEEPEFQRSTEQINPQG